jgi:hypothetical protein
MSQGLQVYDQTGVLIFDSNVNTVVSRIMVVTKTFNRVTNDRYSVSFTEIPNINMRDYYFEVISSQTAIETVWVDESTGTMNVIIQTYLGVSTLNLKVKVYRC